MLVLCYNIFFMQDLLDVTLCGSNRGRESRCGDIEMRDNVLSVVVDQSVSQC